MNAVNAVNVISAINAMSAVNAINGAINAPHVMRAEKLLPVMPVASSARWKVALLRCWHAVSQGRRADPALPETSADGSDPAQQDDAAVSACGWFDSSHDLQQGLRVQEHLGTDGLLHELPLGAWLDLQLSGWRATAPAAVSSALTKAA